MNLLTLYNVKYFNEIAYQKFSSYLLSHFPLLFGLASSFELYSPSATEQQQHTLMQ